MGAPSRALPFLIGLLGALPFAAQVIHLPAAWITRRFGSRRTALWLVALSRQAVLPLVALPFLPLERGARQAIFLSCALLTSALGVAGNNAWTSWMGDLVPGPVRGRYFGRRSAVCALAASLAGGITTLLLRRQHEPHSAAALHPPALCEALAPARDPRLRFLLAFQVAWSAAGGVALAFYPLHMVGSPATA